MIRSIILSFSFIVLLISCKKPSPQEELASLKGTLLKTNERILELEKIIEKADTSTRKVKAKKVSIDTIKPQLFKHYVEGQGIVDAELNVLAAPQVPGVIQSVLVKEGDYVRIGQSLARMDSKTIRQGIEEIRTGLALATTMYDKQKSLWEQNIGSEAQYLLAKNQKEQLEKKLETLKSQVEMSTIKSPVNGTVDEIKVKIGEIAAPGYNGIRVVNNSKLKVKAKLSDIFASRVKKGDKVSIFFPDLNKEIQSTLSFASQSVNAASRTILVESNLPSSKDYKANQTAKIKINDSNIKDAIVVNSNFIQRSINGEDYILVAESIDGKILTKKRIITLGPEYNGYSVVQKGLVKGDLIITNGYSELVDGQLIQL
ncbi:MAG: efflux RND transporter periplasmic adaptor subunit [Saprospiraceae bacterium]|nr:efflux RND transporter periplasmic adaptor subunit [Saprospiraceae bacterium]